MQTLALMHLLEQFPFSLLSPVPKRRLPIAAWSLELVHSSLPFLEGDLPPVLSFTETLRTGSGIREGTG